jgi:hypothetical protein
MNVDRRSARPLQPSSGWLTTPLLRRNDGLPVQRHAASLRGSLPLCSSRFSVNAISGSMPTSSISAATRCWRFSWFSASRKSPASNSPSRRCSRRQPSKVSPRSWPHISPVTTRRGSRPSSRRDRGLRSSVSMQVRALVGEVQIGSAHRVQIEGAVTDIGGPGDILRAGGVVAALDETARRAAASSRCRLSFARRTDHFVISDKRSIQRCTAPHHGGTHRRGSVPSSFAAGHQWLAADRSTSVHNARG